MWLPPVASMLSSDDDEAASASGAAVQMHDRRSIAEALRASNGQVLAEGQPSYHGAYTCIAKGLHVSRFSIGMDATEAHRRMSMICDGRLKRSNLLARPWRTMMVANVKGAMRVLERIAAESTGFVSLHDAVHAFYGGELPEREFRHLVQSVAHSVGFAAPVMLVSPAAVDAALGDRIEYGERYLMLRPSDLKPTRALYSVVEGHHRDALNRQVAKAANLPLPELLEMAGGAQSQKVLLAAVAHLTGKRRLAKLQPVSLERIQRATKDVDVGLTSLGRSWIQSWRRWRRRKSSSTPRHESSLATRQPLVLVKRLRLLWRSSR